MCGLFVPWDWGEGVPWIPGDTHTVASTGLWLKCLSGSYGIRLQALSPDLTCVRALSVLSVTVALTTGGRGGRGGCRRTDVLRVALASCFDVS